MTVENNDDAYKPRGSPYTIWQYAAISIILTPLTAVLLSIYGFIPFGIYHAAMAGFAFSMIFVGYRWYYVKRYRKQERDIVRKSLEDSNKV